MTSRFRTIVAMVALLFAGGVYLFTAVVTSEYPGSSLLGVLGGLVLGVALVVWAHWIARKRAANR